MNPKIHAAARALADAEADAIAHYSIYKAQLDEVHAEHEKSMLELIDRANKANEFLMMLVDSNPDEFADPKSVKLDQLNYGWRLTKREISFNDGDLLKILKAAPEHQRCIKITESINVTVLKTLDDPTLIRLGVAVIQAKNEPFITSKNKLVLPK